MIRHIRLITTSLAAATLLAACSNDMVSPGKTVNPRFSGGSAAGGGAGGGGGGGGTAAGGAGGGSTKVTCTNTLSVTGTATEALAGNAFSASYVLNACQSKTRVSMSVTDLSTGFVVWNSVSDLAGTIALWNLPYNLTTYRVDARAVAGSTNAVVATASTIISAMDPIACDVFVHETATVGYYGIYPAIWAATDIQDCGQGGTVNLKITNMNTGQDELTYPGLSFSSFIDFEGPIVSYSTPYRVYAELRSRSGALLSSSTTDVVSSPLR